MKYILLTGAGFSRNWGGWLASEAFEYLLGCPLIDGAIRRLLWEHKNSGDGFEGALAKLQQKFAHQQNERTKEPLEKLQSAILQMFTEMDAAFHNLTFEPQKDIAHLVRTFLVRFDAIFTLNQDLLIERHYLNEYVTLSDDYRTWTGWEIPGMKAEASDGPQRPWKTKWSPKDPSEFKTDPKFQPYFKLHGSINWIDDQATPLLVMGGGKLASIEQYPILKWNHEQFQEHLSAPETRLMVIGYSFGDRHINEAIQAAADNRNFQLFIIDPHGVDVLNSNQGALITADSPLLNKMEPHLIGASRRSIQAIFGSDNVEHGKVIRFFAPD